MTNAQKLNYGKAKSIWLNGDIEGTENFDESFDDTFKGSGIAACDEPLAWDELTSMLQDYADNMSYIDEDSI